MAKHLANPSDPGEPGIPQYDAVVVGGGIAGLSGALTLARARRTVLVVDSGEPRNAPAAHLHNYLAWDGVPPREMQKTGVREVLAHGGEVTAGRVLSAEPLPGGADPRNGSETENPEEPVGFRVLLDDGSAVAARRLLIATGLVDDLPPVPGLADRWGTDVLHCPYCHGWEVRDQPVGVLATGPHAVDQALLWRQWTGSLTLFQHTAPAFADEEYERLAARGIGFTEGTVTGVATDEQGQLAGVYINGDRIAPCRALVVSPWAAPRAEVCASLGLAAVEEGTAPGVSGSRISADAEGATAVPGVWVAGNLTDPADLIIGAAASGVRAAAAINADLIDSEIRNALRSHRGAAAEFWERQYASRERMWSGEPNIALVREAAGLPPGRALDLGCGEGADAVWLAERGWRVTAVDISRVALERAARHSAAAGLGGRIDWQHRDLATDFPDGYYDLVCAFFLHSPVAIARETILRAAAGAVRSGGILLVVGHAGPLGDDHAEHADGQEPHAPTMPTSDEILDRLRLPPREWKIEAAEEYERPAAPGNGVSSIRHDTMFRLRRSAIPAS